MEEWLENFVMCEKLICEVLNEVGKPQEQVPPMAARKYTPEKIKNHEKPESGPPSACVIGKNRKDLQENKVMGKNGKVVKEGVKSVVKKIKENLKGAENGPKNLEENQLNSRKNRKRGPERVFKETKLINGGKFQIVKCAEFGIERSTKQIRKSSGGGGNTANFNFKKPTNERIPSTKVEMAGKPTNVKLERMPQSTKSDSLDVFSTKPSKNIVENSVEVESVDFVLVDKSTLSLESLENNVGEMGSHQKKESSGKAKRKRTSLEGSQEHEVKSPKKLRKGGGRQFVP